MVEPRLN